MIYIYIYIIYIYILYIYILYIYIYINKYSHIQLHPQEGFGCSSEGSQIPAAFLTPRVTHVDCWPQNWFTKRPPWVEILKRCFKHVHIIHPPEASVHQAGMSDMSELPDVKDNSHGS